MLKIIYLLMVVFCFKATDLFGQELLRTTFTQVLYFDSNGLSGQTEVTPFDINSSNTFTNGMKNLVYYGETFYQVYVATVNDKRDIYLKKSKDGIIWSDRTLISDDTSGVTKQYPAITIGGNPSNPDMCVVWQDNRTGQAQLRAAVSLDGEETFSNSIQVSDHNDSVYLYPAVDRDSTGTYYVSWNRQTSGNALYTTWFSKSADGGVSWLPKQEVYTGRIFSYPTQIAAKGAGELVITLTDDQNSLGNVISFKSDNGGSNWTVGAPVTTYSESGTGLRFFTMLKDQDYSIHVVHPTIQSGLKRINYSVTKDWSSEWSAAVAVSDTSYEILQSKSSNENIPSAAISESGTIYASWADKRFEPSGDTFSLFITRSTDNGQTWDNEIEFGGEAQFDYSRGSISMAVKSGANMDTVVLVWSEVKEITTNLRDNRSILLNEYKLSQNYPNPFNPQTTITYQIPETDRVKIILYDIKGREIKTLVNHRHQAGVHTILLNEGNFPSGVYFYTLTTSTGFNQSRKMILIK